MHEKGSEQPQRPKRELEQEETETPESEAQKKKARTKKGKEKVTDPEIISEVQGYLQHYSKLKRITKKSKNISDLKKILDKEKMPLEELIQYAQETLDENKITQLLKALDRSIEELGSTELAVQFIEQVEHTSVQKIKSALEIGNKDLLVIFAQNFYYHLDQLNMERESRDIDWSDRRFDSLSRLLVSDINDCAAVCFDGEKILYAFNHLHSNSPDKRGSDIQEHADRVLDYFTRCANRKYTDGEIKLADRMEIIVETCSTALHLKEIEDKERIKNIINLLDKYSEKIPEEFKGVINTKELNQAIRTRRDLMKVEEALTTTQGNRFNDTILAAFKNGKDEGYCLVKGGEAHDKCHAEMRIVERLLNSSVYLNKVYVGVSKLCCAHCHLVITNDLSAPLMLEYQDDEGKAIKVPIYTRGHHGQSFEWIIVDAIKNKPDQLKHFLGEETYKLYQELEDEANQKLALEVIVQEIGDLSGEQLEELFDIKIRSHHTTMGGSDKQHADMSPSDTEADINARSWRGTIEYTLDQVMQTAVLEEQKQSIDNEVKTFSDISQKLELYKLYAEKIISFMLSEDFSKKEYATNNFVKALEFSIENMNNILSSEYSNEHYTQEVKYLETLKNVFLAGKEKGYQEGLSASSQKTSSSKPQERGVLGQHTEEYNRRSQESKGSTPYHSLKS